MSFKASRTERTKNKAQRLPSLWSALLTLLVTISSIITTKAQNKNPNDKNTQFDPEVGRNNTNSCYIPPYQKPAFEPTADMCEEATVSLEGLSSEQLKALAKAYAPYLFFHPLEKYFIENVNATFEDPDKGKVWKNKPLKQVQEILNQSFMLETNRNIHLSMHSEKYFFTHELTEDYTRGAAFSGPEGNLYKSTAPIYFNAFEKTYEDPDRTVWVFNYYFYYTFNGVANMMSLSSYEGVESYTPFILSPFGLHEGDWEGMSVMVCPSTTASQPLAVTYQQHGWQQTTDCTAGECTFFKKQTNPVGFSALNSHATFPVTTEHVIYSNIEVPFFVNLQAILVVDRTAYLAADGTYHAFVPETDNVVETEGPQETYDEYRKWQGFGGLWGNATKPVIFPELQGCLNDIQTEFIDCPTEEEDPVFHLVMQLLNVREAGNDLISKAGQGIGSLILPMFAQTGVGPTGPTLKNHWNDWPDPSNAPLWNSGLPPNTTSGEYCSSLLENIHDTSRLPPNNNDLDVMGHLVGIIVMVVCLVVLTVVFLAMEKKMRHQLIEFDPDTGEAIKPTRRTWFQVHVPSLTFTFWWVVIVIGAIMFGTSLADLFDDLEMYITGINWNAIRALVMILGIIIMIIDLVLCVFIWLPSQSLWKKIMQIYHHYKGEEEEVEVYKKDHCNLSFGTLHTLFLISFPLLFVSLMLTLVVVVTGVGVVGFSAAFNEICDATLGSLDGICLNLSFFGIEQVACGADFQEFCNQWAESGRYVTLWGSILVAVGHYYLVGSAGAAYKQQSAVMPMLDMLPRRKDYLQRIEDIAEGQADVHQSGKSARSDFMDDVKE